MASPNHLLDLGTIMARTMRFYVLFAVLTLGFFNVASADLTGFFDFDGNLTDQTNNAPVVYPRLSGYAPGAEGGAIELNGQLDYLFVPIGRSGNSRPVQTFGAWVRAEVPNRRQTLLTIEDFSGSTPNRSIGIDNRAGGGFRFTTTVGPPERRVAAGGPATNDWTFVAARYDGSDVTFFVNGDSVTTSDNTLRNPNGNAFVHVGSLSVRGVGFRGQVDNLFLFDEALSDTQIESIRVGGASAILSVSAIPEPSFFALGLGTIALVSFRRRGRAGSKAAA